MNWVPNIQNIATKVDVSNALQTQLDTNIDNESLKNYSLDIDLFLSTYSNINEAKILFIKKIHGYQPKITNFPSKNKGG